MTGQTAIIGDGIAAALAVFLGAAGTNITVIKPAQPARGALPEIVPRRAFFDRLAVSSVEEAAILGSAAPTPRHVIRFGADNNQRIPLATTNAWFVYDKRRLADALFAAAPPHRTVISAGGNITDVADLGDYDRIFDARGAKAVAADPAYHVWPRGRSETVCRYLIAKMPTEGPAAALRFWEGDGLGLGDSVLFAIPIDEGRVSIGCSSRPGQGVSAAELIFAARSCGIALDDDGILLSGFVEPMPTWADCRLETVIPIGTARRFACPLTEYGCLMALRDVCDAFGRDGTPTEADMRRHILGPDPHLPEELLS